MTYPVRQFFSYDNIHHTPYASDSDLPQLDEFTNFCGSDEGRLIADQLAMVQEVTIV